MRVLVSNGSLVHWHALRLLLPLVPADVAVPVAVVAVSATALARDLGALIAGLTALTLLASPRRLNTCLSLPIY